MHAAYCGKYYQVYATTTTTTNQTNITTEYKHYM